MSYDPIVKKVNKKPKNTHKFENPYEVLKDFSFGIAEETTTQAKGIFDEFISELIPLHRKGDLEPGQELNLKAHEEQQKKQATDKQDGLEKKANHIRPAIEHIDY